jgi:hypothetical protein
MYTPNTSSGGDYAGCAGKSSRQTFVEKIDDVGEEQDIDTVEGPGRLVRMDDLCIAVVLQGCERRVEFGEPTSGRRTASPPPKEAGTVLDAVLAAPVPDRTVGASNAIPMCLPRMQQR